MLSSVASCVLLEIATAGASRLVQKLPSAVRGDVYARAPPEEDGPSERLYFIGKVIAEVAAPSASLAAQQTLVKEHARLYLPDVFAAVTDEAMELWLAPGNTEMRVAQNEISLKQWAMPPADVELPAAGACGFEPETAPPPHMGTGAFSVRRDASGAPLAKPFQSPLVSPDQVPGAYQKWMEGQK